MIVLIVDQLGQIVATPGALVALATADTSPSTLLRRHASGDWGDLDAHDRAANDAALRDGSLSWPISTSVQARPATLCRKAVLSQDAALASHRPREKQRG